jgi:hypothetical protein
VITDLACEVTGGELCAGDDADDARWFTAADLTTATTSPNLLETLAEWAVLPR